MDSASLEEDWYAVLEVHGYASESDIKQAFRRLALLCHPDKNRGNEAASAVKFVQVTIPPPLPKKKKPKTHTLPLPIQEPFCPPIFPCKKDELSLTNRIPCWCLYVRRQNSYEKRTTC